MDGRRGFEINLSSQKKIALVIPSLNVGGMERVMSELASYFSKFNQVEVHLVMYGKAPELFYTIPKSIIIHKPNIKFNNQLRIISTIRRFLYLRKEIKRIHPNSILSFGEYWNSFVLMALWGTKHPVFVSDRCQPDKSLGKIHDRLRRYLYPLAKGVIVQTTRAAEIYQNLIPKANIQIIGNPIKSFQPNNKVKKDNIVLTIGRLIKTKHHDRLISIFVGLNAPEWKLVIIGGNALNQNNETLLRKTIIDLNLQDKIILTGSIKHIDEYYQKSKIFALTSSSEGFPNVIGEALSAGLPVVAYDCVAGPSDMINNGRNGFLIPVFDDEQFREKLQLLVDDQNLREELGNAGILSIPKFSNENIGKQFFSLLTQ